MEHSMKEFIKQMKEENPFLSNTETVYQAIRNEIVNHKIKPGEKMNQEQLAEELNVSRTPIRDALYLLEKDGYLTKSGQGYVVYEMTLIDYMRLVDLRAAIECLAVRLACFKIRVSESKKIKENLQKMQNLLKEGFDTAWDEDLNVTDEKRAIELMRSAAILDKEFHELIVGASHNEYVIETYAHLSPKIHFYRNNILNLNHAMNMMRRHTSIYESIVKRDEDEAEKKMSRHLQLTVGSAK